MNSRVESDPRRSCVSLSANALRKDMNPSILSSAMRKILGQTGFSQLAGFNPSRIKVSVQYLRGVVRSNLWKRAPFFLLSAYPKRVASSSGAFTTVKNLLSR